MSLFEKEKKNCPFFSFRDCYAAVEVHVAVFVCFWSRVCQYQ